MPSILIQMRFLTYNRNDKPCPRIAPSRIPCHMAKRLLRFYMEHTHRSPDLSSSTSAAAASDFSSNVSALLQTRSTVTYCCRCIKKMQTEMRTTSQALLLATFAVLQISSLHQNSLRLLGPCWRLDQRSRWVRCGLGRGLLFTGVWAYVMHM